MAYQVALADSAKADANRIYDWVVERAPFEDPSGSRSSSILCTPLEQLPNRCPLAREAGEAKRDIRCLLFGKRRGVYRILYEVDEKRQMVWILHIRHGALQDLRPDELSRSPE